MFRNIRLQALLLCSLLAQTSSAQQILSARIINDQTGEPIEGASIQVPGRATSSDARGAFSLSCPAGCRKATVSFIGYNSTEITVDSAQPFIRLSPITASLQEVVVSASRQAVRRSEAPVAITAINNRSLQETKAISIDQLLNKVSGVNMVNLGNEQHQMSIRQPMTTKSLFLYLEDGISIRTTGLFNHNALLELNMAAVKTMEVIKGPSSSLYGSEAIGGVVNVITAAPTAQPFLKLSAQGNNIGYRRADLQSSASRGRWGFALNGYYATKKNGFIEYSDFSKATLTARADYRVSERTTLVNSATWMRYQSDMTGAADSLAFARRSFKSLQTFTYRNVDALRYRSTLTHQWNGAATTTASLVYRNNVIEQNPSYSIRNDYRKLPSGLWTGKKNVAHGEINRSAFNSYAFIGQHRQHLTWKNADLIGGASIDLSPTSYKANYIRINRDTVTGKYTNYTAPDSVLTNYRTGINNYAAFANFEFNPVAKLRVVASLRYDQFVYRFNNALAPSAFSGAPDTTNHFSALSPKLGFTYNFSGRTGVYANYSQGFVPPQVTELYRGVKVPQIKPATFYNYEVGGWAEIIKGKLNADISLYQLEGTNEIISVRLDDGTTENRNAGRTSHKGVELGINGSVGKDLSYRYSAAYSEHHFNRFVEKGNNYNGKEMNGAPRWMHNAALWYRSASIKGLRIGAEWQCIGSYFMDPLNTTKYKGYQVLNLRAGYQYKAFEYWVNAMNITNAYYSYNTAKSSSGYSYIPADLRNFVVGASWRIGK